MGAYLYYENLFTLIQVPDTGMILSIKIPSFAGITLFENAETIISPETSGSLIH